MHCGFISAAFTSYARYMRYFFVAVTAILCFGLVLFGPQAAAGAAEGFELFISCVFPSLFPFFVCVALLKGLGVFGVKSGRAGAAIFKIFAVSLISGTPTGPMLIGSVLPENTELNYKKQQLNNELRSALAALTNLASPVFIAGAVCSRMFGFRERKAALLLAFSHYGAAALSVSLLMLLASALNCKFRPAADSQSRIRAAAVFPKAVRESVNSILLVGGTLVFFVVAVRLLESSGIVSLFGLNELQKGTLFGLLEMTNGIKILSAEPVSRLSLVLTCVLMSFGGLCIFLQTCGVVNLRPVGYFAAKLFHALLSAALCAAMYPLFFSNAAPVFISTAESAAIAENVMTAAQIALLCLFSSCISALAAVFAVKSTRT